MSEEMQGANEPVVAEPVSTEPVQNAEPSVNTPEPAEPVKPVQDEATNARFAEVRRNAEREARDNTIRELYGDQGITTYEQYQQALARQQEAEARQKMLDNGIDPDLIDERVNNHPVVKQAQEFLTKQQEEAKFNSEANELFDMFPELDAKQIQPEVWKLRGEKGLSLLDSYLRVNFKNIKSQGEQEAIQKLTKNAQTSPGALSSEGVDHNTSVAKMSDKEFKSLQERVLRGEKIQL